MDDMTIYDAAVFGNFPSVRALLRQNPDLVNATDKYGFTPLHGGAGEHHFDMARLLIKHDADVNAKNDQGITPLHLAAHPEIVDILLANGANLEARSAIGRTPLHVATEHPESNDVMASLLRHGADVNAIDTYGLTPLDFAYEREDQDKADLLRKYGGLRRKAI
ncbi:MAG: ankyrin repeat domain-containing protein [Pseudomonadota bacterium]|nr:ankyrin repeat domain-containing protein [Pseudomonadota bacterium]